MTSRFRSVWRSWYFLLGALILQLIFNPCWETEIQKGARWILLVLNSLVVLTVIHKLSERASTFIIGLMLGLPAVILYWLPRTPALDLSLLILTGALYLYAIIMLIPTLLRSTEGTAEELAGGASLYILLGLTWAILYTILELAEPQSFSVTGLLGPDEPLALGAFTYFSFTTLTTLGYGDLVPVSCQARALSILEVISGLLCLSLIVARLLSIHTAKLLQRQRRR